MPTTDTVRYSFLLAQCVKNTLPLMFIGTTGTGKSILVKDMFLNHISKDRYVPMFLQFSAQTSANQTQVYDCAKTPRHAPAAPHFLLQCSGGMQDGRS